MEGGEKSLITQITKYLAGFGGTIGIITAILYGSGFLVMRTHLAMLGIWTEIPILKDMYLYEGGLFFVYSIYYLAFVVPSTLVLIGIAYGLKIVFSLILHGLGKIFKKIIAHPQSKNDESLLTKVPRRTWQIILLILVIVIFPRMYSYALFIKGLLFYQSQKTGGSGSLPVVARWLQQSLLQGNQLVLFNYYGGLVVGMMVVGFLIWYGHSKNDDVTSKVLRFVLGMVFILQVLLLPLNYGTLIKPTIYPKAYVDSEEIKGELVWLLYENSQNIIVYRSPSQKEGGILTIKKDTVKGLQIISRDNILKK